MAKFLWALYYIIETFQEDVESYDPLLHIDLIRADDVEEVVDPVHQHLICHGTVGVEELPEHSPVHLLGKPVPTLVT